MLPRIPLVSDYQKFWAFSKAGRELAELHLNYETVDAYPDVKIESLDYVEYADETPKQVRGDSIIQKDDGVLMVADSPKGKRQFLTSYASFFQVPSSRKAEIKMFQGSNFSKSFLVLQCTFSVL